MYLKSIEMQGFKSFAGKMTLEFHNGITGIVGPNGSGKSNVSDAVRWVLGEQSAKQLRGASMQDVIFAGTENRKPLSYAYVCLTLDNSDHVLPTDYDEVTVARRVYRSGESEYLLNGVSCRLRDVNELFYDTGIGKEGYSIIGQGQIDKILSGKPEDRRELFDEAVGIVKFKKRKQMTLKKLEDEEENLSRVTDILKELESRVGPLEKQAATAKEYLKKKEELKKLDVNMFLLESDRLKTQLSEVGKNLLISQGQLADQHAKEEEIKTQYAKIEQSINEIDEKISDIFSNQQNNSVNKEKLEAQIKIYEEQIRLAKISDEGLDTRKQSLSDEITLLQKELEVKKQEFDRLNETLNASFENLKNARSNEIDINGRIAEIRATIETDQNKLLVLLDEMSDIKSKEQRLAALTEQLTIRRADLTQRILLKKNSTDNLEENLSSGRDKAEEAREKLDNLRAKDRELKLRQYDFKQKQSALNNSYINHRTDIQKKEAMAESLRNLAERYEGYGYAVKRVMDSGKPGVCGVISDLITVQTEYQTAIETALGGNIQNVVTEDEDTARQLIAFLKENRYGRVTFLPVSSVKASSGLKNPACLKEKGALGIASQLVECEGRYQNVVSHLLGRVLVVDKIENALAIAKKYGYSMHIVTLEGEYLSPGGSLTGGSFKNNSNLLGRKREIEDLEKEISKLRKELAEEKGRLDDLETALSLMEEDIADNTELLNAAILEDNTAGLELKVLEDQHEENSKAYDSLNREGEDLSRQSEEIENDKASIQNEITYINTSSDDLNAEIASLQKELEDLSVKQTQAQELSRELSVEEAKARQAAEFARENHDRIHAEIEKKQTEFDNLDAEAEISRNEAAEKEKYIAEIRITIEEALTQAGKLDDELRESRDRKEKLNADHKKLFEEREQISDTIRVLDKEIFRLTGSKEKAEEALNYQTTYMWEEYELTYHAALELKDDELIAAGSLRKNISAVKDEIRRMGNVNVNAIEEYREVGERYEFLKTQYDDLVLAKENLEDIIAELDRGMKKQFAEEFANIQNEFDKTFKELFGGGKGTLELMEGEDILDTGIMIIAQPPGKKLQNMMQLSGGEKALTAIALLFAIQNLKPSPFCLLDEIEAALDDVNVDRFANYLHKLTSNTQFIIITHRRGTMNAADRLYGITMQEKGISAMVSVNLIENELEN